MVTTLTGHSGLLNMTVTTVSKLSWQHQTTHHSPGHHWGYTVWWLRLRPGQLRTSASGSVDSVLGPGHTGTVVTSHCQIPSTEWILTRSEPTCPGLIQIKTMRTKYYPIIQDVQKYEYYIKPSCWDLLKGWMMVFMYIYLVLFKIIDRGIHCYSTVDICI